MRVGIEIEDRTGPFDFIGFSRKFARRVSLDSVWIHWPLRLLGVNYPILLRISDARSLRHERSRYSRPAALGDR